jgi:hypothetical protein
MGRVILQRTAGLTEKNLRGIKRIHSKKNLEIFYAGGWHGVKRLVVTQVKFGSLPNPRAILNGSEAHVDEPRSFKALVVGSRPATLTIFLAFQKTSGGGSWETAFPMSLQVL